jgi:hypothetical protein
MTPLSTNPPTDTPPPALKEWESDANGVETDTGDDGCRPAPARQIRVADLQHWLDLCA